MKNPVDYKNTYICAVISSIKTILIIMINACKPFDCVAVATVRSIISSWLLSRYILNAWPCEAVQMNID